MHSKRRWDLGGGLGVGLADCAKLAGMCDHTQLSRLVDEAALEGSYARHLAGMTDDPFFAELEGGVPALASRALAIARS